MPPKTATHPWLQWILDILGADEYYQHAICLTNDQFMVWLFAGSDMLIFISYFIIGGSLLLHHARIVAVSEPTRILYGVFIFMCGLTHLTSTMVLFSGVYRLHLFIKFITAAVSAVTAVMTTREVALGNIRS